MLLVSFCSASGLRTGLVVAISIPLVLAMTFVFMEMLRHRPAQDLARRADPRARPAGRRRDHRGRDDGDQDGAGLRPRPRRQLRLYQHRVPDADRHAGHRRRIPADRDGEVRHRRIHALDLRGVGDRAADLVVRRGGGDSLPRLQAAARSRDNATPRASWAAAARRARVSVRSLAPRAQARRRIDDRRSRLRTRAFYRRFRALVDWCVGASQDRDRAPRSLRSSLSLVGFGFVQQQFFPRSTRPELLVDLRLAGRRSFAATLDAGRRSSKGAGARSPASRTTSATSASAARASTCRSTSSCRRRTSRSSSLTAKSIDERETIAQRLVRLFDDDFAALRGRVSRLENGPPVGFPGAVPRLRRRHRDRARRIARRSPTVVRAESAICAT